MIKYHLVDGLELFYLEDSWVLDVAARPGSLTIRLDVVLVPEHPNYHPPLPGEQYCYCRGELRFEGVIELQWAGQGMPPAQDASDEIDYGNIDSMTLGQDTYFLEGGFGEIRVRAKSVRMVLAEPDC